MTTSGDLTIIVALIGATAIIVGAVITARLGNKSQLSDIHVLVNSRLTEALEEIQSLRAQIKRLKKKDT